MSFRSEEVMISLLPQGQTDDDDNGGGGGCTNNTRVGGDTGGAKSGAVELASLKAQLRRAIESRA